MKKVLIGVLALMAAACSNNEDIHINKQVPPHHTEDGFKNLHGPEKQSGFFDYWYMRWFGETEWADQSEQVDAIPFMQADLNTISTPNPEDRQVTWIGHSTFLLQYQGMAVLTDPIFSERASPVSFMGPQRLTELPVQLSDLPPIDAVIISHDHYDHLDADTIETLGNSTHYFVPLALKPWFLELGIAEDNVTELDWWQGAATNDQLRVHATPSQHWSGRSLWDRFETLWASYVIDIGDWRVWFGGDTGYNAIQFKEIGHVFNDIDLALMPVGAYLPRWFMKMPHVDPEQATLIHQDIGAKQSITMHWGAFQLAAEGIPQTIDDIKHAREKAQLSENEFRIMPVGATEILTSDSVK
ncbi:MAG: metallo hydrolase [Idiomarina sp. T82-3]|uniref:MBL fold metallo-hydrolase n=1 Tax=Idiomarina TaxID=135575 RepID=UPI00079C7E6F|nr:MBL fold metallo-hydrolase [Idiomarina sp. T82-3]KXS34590.1 MAG: metallo hydrolase [Idiomarina sp. T82-3]